MGYDIERVFRYYAPTTNQIEYYQSLRSTAKGLAEEILAKCPDSRERSLALTKIEEAVMWANASIARNG